MINETKIETVLSPSEIQYHLPSTSLLIDYDEDLISTPLFVPDRPTEKVSVEPTKVFDRDYFSATASTIPNIIYEDKTDRSRPQKVNFLRSKINTLINDVNFNMECFKGSGQLFQIMI